MNWTLRKTGDMETVLALYCQVFHNEMRPEDFTRKTTGKKTYCFLLGRNDDPPVGFAILLGEDSEVELWNCGIIPAGRMKGAGSALVGQVKRAMAQEGYSRMNVTTFNRWNVMLVILLRQGFRIVATEYSSRWKDMAISLVTELGVKQEIRYALTEECNFKCLFCHNEGLGHDRRKRRQDHEILAILKEASRIGYSDITLTGGEPLLRKERLYALLEGFGEMDARPEITLVTNGSLLDDETIRRLRAYKGKIKLHISCHATDPEGFARLTGTNDLSLFDRVNARIKAATRSGLGVKMNCVLIKGENHSRVAEAVELARSLGASAIKFIELLVLPDSPADYTMYYDISAIIKDLKKIAVEAPGGNARRHTFVHRQDSTFFIEAQKCTCALGCSHCRELRDRTFSSDMKYHPCFVRHKNSYPVDSPVELGETFLQGDRIIDGYAFKFRDSSPTLIEKEEFISTKQEYFFEIDSVDAFREYLRGNGFELTGKKGYYLEHYQPRHLSSEWERFERILKIGWDSHDKSKVSLIYTDHTYRLVTGIGLETSTRYLDPTGPMTFENEEKARRFLDRLDFEHLLTMELDLETLKRGDLSISLATDGKKHTVKISGDNETARRLSTLIHRYGGKVRALDEPFVSFMKGS